MSEQVKEQVTGQVTEQSTERMTEQTEEQKTEVDAIKAKKQEASQLTEHPAKHPTEQTTGRISGRMAGQVTGQVINQNSDSTIEKAIITFCKKPKSRKEIQEYLGLVSRSNFIEKYIRPLLSDGRLKMTIPDKPHSQNQKYISKSIKKRKKSI